jgi:hypothetical protein
VCFDILVESYSNYPVMRLLSQWDVVLLLSSLLLLFCIFLLIFPVVGKLNI